jgi:adenylate cyclase
VIVRRLRLGTGLVLFTYVTTHLLNHALGLVSLAAMDAARPWFLALWRNPAGTLLLYGSLLTHLALALWSLYRRRHLRMPAWEASQLLLGLSVPPLLISHVIGTRVAFEWMGVIDAYARLMLLYWVQRPWGGVQQALVLVLAWLHGCVGLHFWLRLKPWYARAAPWLLAPALLVPVLAVLGFAEAGREVRALVRQPGWAAMVARDTHAATPEQRERIERARDRTLGAYGASVLLVLVARAGRRAWERRRRTVTLTYPGDRHVVVPPGLTVLEASRLAGIPHASVCGGRGRCSTCRVRVVRGLHDLEPPAADEQRVLARVGAPPNVRLACQIRPTRDITVIPLLPAGVGALDSQPRPGHWAGDERQIAVLFADVRGFTTIAEHRLPYDVVFLLNRYFEAVGGAIERSGGTVNQFTGDGVMALFGVDSDLEAGCRAALAAAGEIVRSVAELSRTLAEDLTAPLRIGIGIHAGPAVVGHMGYGVAKYLTAVGDTVHVAKRLEELTKEYGCDLVISEPVAQRAGVDVSRFPRREQIVRNRREPLPIRIIHDARTLDVSPASPASAAGGTRSLGRG